MTIAGTTVTKASFSVDMTTVTSDRESARRPVPGPDHGHGRLPHRHVRAHEPINLAPVPKDGVIKKYSATGKLTLHGTTKTVTIPLNTKRTGNVIQVQGILPITFPDYNIDNPSGGPPSVGNVGQMEFLLELQPS